MVMMEHEVGGGVGAREEELGPQKLMAVLDAKGDVSLHPDGASGGAKVSRRRWVREADGGARVPLCAG
jgi:trehalose-6-phosphatase